MYAICSTKLNDVKNCVKEMVRQLNSEEKLIAGLPIVQFGSKVYKRLDEDRSLMAETINKKRKDVSRAINMKTLTIHKHTCSHRGLRVNVVGARLINIPKTGLKVCGHCS